MKTRGGIVFAVVLLLVGALGILLSGCGVGLPGAAVTSRVTLALGSTIGNKSIVPGQSMDVLKFVVHGQGTSGAATGASFDLPVTATGGAGSGVVDLLPGDWKIGALAWNTDTPSIAVGDSEIITKAIIVGTSATVVLHCLPYSGKGTFVVHESHVPNILMNPDVDVEVQRFVGDQAVTNIEMTKITNTAFDGSDLLGTGWWKTFLRITDGGVLSAGMVEVVRIARDATSTWSPYLQVNQLLAGGVTIPVDWQPYKELTLGTTPPAATTVPGSGAVSLYDGGTASFKVDSTDKDSGTGLFYAWYLNGELASVGGDDNYSFLADKMSMGQIRYVSVVVWQTGGLRAGSANWKVTRLANDPTLLAITGTLTCYGDPPRTERMAVRLANASGVVIESIPAILSDGNVQTLNFNFASLPPVVYTLVAWMDGGPGGQDGVFNYSVDGHYTYFAGVATLPMATPIVIPHPSGQTFNFILRSGI